LIEYYEIFIEKPSIFESYVEMRVVLLIDSADFYLSSCLWRMQNLGLLR
jgi:hypothetical protein